MNPLNIPEKDFGPFGAVNKNCWDWCDAVNIAAKWAEWGYFPTSFHHFGGWIVLHLVAKKIEQ